MTNLDAYQILRRHTFIYDHALFNDSDGDLGRLNWHAIDNHEWSFKQQIIIEVVRFILTNTGNAQLEDLLTLNEQERGAVLLALNEKFKVAELN